VSQVARIKARAAEGEWVVGRTGGGRTAARREQTVAGQYRDDEILWLREERAQRYACARPPLAA
jgi:hypothetical protein